MDSQPRLRRVSTAPTLLLALDPVRRSKEARVARLDTLPLEDQVGRGRMRERLGRDTSRRSATAEGFSSVRRQSRARRSDATAAIDFRPEREEPLEPTSGVGVDFEAFRQATTTAPEHALRPYSTRRDNLTCRRSPPRRPSFVSPTIDSPSTPISPSFALPASLISYTMPAPDEEDDTPSSFWSPEVQTARHIAQFGAGGGPSSSSTFLSPPSSSSTQSVSSRPRRISYDVPEELEAWMLAQGSDYDADWSGPRIAQKSPNEGLYRQSDAWKEEESELYGRRRSAAAKRLEMVARQLAWT